MEILQTTITGWAVSEFSLRRPSPGPQRVTQRDHRISTTQHALHGPGLDETERSTRA